MFAELADRSPSSAGFYLDTQGRMVVVVVEEGDDGAARIGATSLLAAGRINDPRPKMAGIVIERGRYTFSQLAQWRDAVHERILGTVPGVISLDLAEQRNRVTIGLARGSEATLRGTLPSRLTALGIDTSAVAYRVHDPIARTSANSSVAPTRTPLPRRSTSYGLTYTWDTMVGGILISLRPSDLIPNGGSGGCTLGVVADRGSVRGFVTASHCSSSEYYIDNGAAYQPDSGPGVRIGNEHTDLSGEVCGVFQTNYCRDSDASFYSLLSTIASERGLIARTQSSAGPGSGYGTLVIDTARPYFFISSVDNNDAVHGQYVQKVGITTGWTWGTIADTCTDHAHGGFFSGGFWVTDCVYEATYTDHRGDSGGPVFTFEGNGYNQSGDFVKLVGIHRGHFGDSSATGRAVFSKWGRIIGDLGAMTVTRAASLSTPSVSGTILFTAPSLSWPAISGATRYNVYRLTDNGSSVITESLGTTTNTYLNDGDKNVLDYTGTSQPNGSGTKIKYFVYAVNGTNISAMSTPVWYQGASGTFSVSVNGPSEVGPNNYTCGQWVAQVTGAATITSYEWTGLFTGTDYYVSGTVPQNGGQFQVMVQDSQGRQGGVVFTVNYNPHNTDACV